MVYFLRIFLVGCLLAAPCVVTGQHDVSPPGTVEASLRDTTMVSINLTLDPHSSVIDAFAFDLHYPNSLMTFISVSDRGTLTDGWTMVEGSENSPGVITIGGFNLEPITSSGILLHVGFVVGDVIGQTQLSLTTFTDDLEDATTTSGLLTIASQTDVANGVSGDDGLPACHVLQQNHPNPFNPKTDIRYQIPDRRFSTHTTLKIYSILGQEVMTLVDEEQDGGHYSVTWDGRDSRGHVVSSGVYMYRLEAGSLIRTKKMLFVK